MSIPTLRLDVAPPSSPWRLNHGAIGWTVLAAGILALAASAGATLRAHAQASRSGQQAARTLMRARQSEDANRRVLDELRSVDVAREMPRWRLAERILTERSLPWSRLTSELERSLVEGVRVWSLQRTRGADQKVQIKVRGEARTRQAEAGFVEALRANPFFEQVVLERESERQGGGVDFEYALSAHSVPPPYAPLAGK